MCELQASSSLKFDNNCDAMFYIFSEFIMSLILMFFCDIMIQDMINSENSMNTTESANTNIFKLSHFLFS